MAGGSFKLKVAIISIFTIGFILFLNIQATADPAQILQLLDEGRMDELANLRETASGEEKKFLDAVFEPKASVAVVRFLDFRKNYPKSPLAYEALERLYEYNYALGYYNKADEYKKMLKDKPQQTKRTPPQPLVKEKPVPEAPQKGTPKAQSPSSAQYWVQCGAYSYGENAVKLGSQLKALNYPVSILNKIPGERKYFLVRVGGFTDRAQADKVASEIKRKLGIDARVVQENQ